MTAATITLTDFLLQRIADDEAVARNGFGPTVYGDGVQGDYAALEVAEMGRAEGASELGYAHLLRWMPIRVLADCAAKRKIVEAHVLFAPDPSQLADEEDGGTFSCEVCDARLGFYREDQFDYFRSDGCDTLRALASVYADHDEFDPRWAL